MFRMPMFSLSFALLLTLVVLAPVCAQAAVPTSPLTTLADLSKALENGSLDLIDAQSDTLAAARSGDTDALRLARQRANALLNNQRGLLRQMAKLTQGTILAPRDTETLRRNIAAVGTLLSELDAQSKKVLEALLTQSDISSELDRLEQVRGDCLHQVQRLVAFVRPLAAAK